MNQANLVNLLTNSGLKVIGIDKYYVYLEDPSCILPAFDLILHYAWIIAVILTALMLFGWGVLYIKNGAKLGNIFTNFRNLFLIFLTLSIVKPIVNMVYGDDLFGKQCETKRVSLSSVNELLEMRNKKLSSSDEFLLSESWNIIDSGISIKDLPNTITTTTTYSENTSSNPNNFVSVSYEDKTTIYITSDGQRIKRIGGSVAWRNNNPGNIRKSKIAYNNGAIGETDQWAVFPDEETGLNAIVKLLKSENYTNLSVEGAIHRWAPFSDGNNPDKYSENVSKMTGLASNAKINNLSDSDLKKIARAIQQIEGWIPGTEQKM